MISSVFYPKNTHYFYYTGNARKIQETNGKKSAFSEKQTKEGCPTGFLAIICEYHPFHYGHAKQLAAVRAQNPEMPVLALMSGNFVQRGEVAIWDKYTRAAAAVRAGVDLVLELPFPYAMSGAAFFADGAISTLVSLGCVDRLCFGSESGDLPMLQTVATRLQRPEFAKKMQQARQTLTLSQVRLTQTVYTALYGEAFPTEPNDILGVEYLKAIRKHGGKIEPFVLRRTGKDSATVARRIFWEQPARFSDLVPPAAYACYQTASRVASMERLTLPLFAHLRTADPAKLAAYAEVTTDAAYRMCTAANRATCLQDLLIGCINAGYPAARVRRMLLSCLVGIPQTALHAPPAYTTVLAANARGREGLRILAKTSRIPVFAKPAHAAQQADTQAMYRLSCRADAVYTLAQNPPAPADFFAKQHPYIL